MAMENDVQPHTGPHLGRASAGLCGTTGDNLLRFLQGFTSHMEEFLGEYVYTSYMNMIALFSVFVYKF